MGFIFITLHISTSLADWFIFINETCSNFKLPFLLFLDERIQEQTVKTKVIL